MQFGSRQVSRGAIRPLASSPAAIDICLLPARWAVVLPAPQPVWNALLTPVAAVVFVLLSPWIPHLCLMRTLLHLPCPGCGVTSSLRALLHLRPLAAWQANPAGIMLGLFLLLQAVRSFRTLLVPSLPLRPAWPSFKLRWVTAALFLVWMFRLLEAFHGSHLVPSL